MVAMAAVRNFPLPAGLETPENLSHIRIIGAAKRVDMTNGLSRKGGQNIVIAQRRMTHAKL